MTNTTNNQTTNNPQIISGTTGGAHLTDGPLTTTAATAGSPDLLTSEIDSRIVKIRPMATPIDQISRMVGSRPAPSMKVEYYSVDTRPVESTVKGRSKASADQLPDLPPTFTVATANDRLFAPTDTIMFPDVTVETPGGQEEALTCYVSDVLTGTESGLKLIALNMGSDDEIPELTDGMKIVRMGRAAAELDVQTAQFEALPVKDHNYCQIFKAQVEQSALMRLSSKEVGWNLSDQEEVAIMDMRMGMEKSFLFGTMARLTDPRKMDEVLFTRGIWNQAGEEATLSLGSLTQNDLIELMKKAFTGNAAGSPRKVLVAGSELILAINKLESTKVIMAGDTITRWGIDFNEIRSKFGSLYVVHAEVFDQCGHANDGLIIDPQYLTKYTHVPFRVERLDLKKSGVRNTDALVATEASCLVLRHPKTHVKIRGTWD